MNQPTLLNIRLRPTHLLLLITAALALGTGCRKENRHNNNNDLANFGQVILVANKASYNPKLVDSSLQNAWGLTFSSNGIAWVNSLAGHVSELYTGEGARVRAGVNIPSPTDSVGGLPTGVVFSTNKGFRLPNNQGSNFLFVGVDGVLSGWNGATGNNAFRLKNNAATSVYTGLTLASKGSANFIYAANFRTGRIDVWDTTFASVQMSFRDPGVPRGYAPFNIQAIGSWLYVTYAKVGADGEEEKAPGAGFVSIFNTDGSFVKRFATGGTLNAPWGVVQAPAGWVTDSTLDRRSDRILDDHGGGDNSGHGNNNGGNNNNSGPGNNHDNDDKDHVDNDQPTILVGNFGDGRINVYSTDGKFLGQLRSHNHTIVIDGLWALSFPPSTATTIDPNRLYFTAGPADETDGVFGYLIRQ